MFRYKYWNIFAIITVSLVIFAAISWISAHPFGVSWDEAEYFNRALADLASAQSGPMTILKSILFEDRIRPPAFRALILPFTLILGFSSSVVRLTSLTFFLISLLLVYRTAKRIANPIAGAMAVIFLCLGPYVILSSMMFGTEYPLLLAAAAMMYFLFRDWDSQRVPSYNWVGLGLALGLGALAKTSFALIAGPILAISYYFSWRKIGNGPGLGSLTKAIMLGAFVAFPWWLLNARSALWYAKYSSNFVRHSIDGTILYSSIMWLYNLIQSELGLMLAIFTSFLFLILIYDKIIVNQELTPYRTQKVAMLICFISPMPLVFAQLIGKNVNLRHLTPAMIPWAVGIGILASLIYETHSRSLFAAANILFGIQLFMVVIPAAHPIIYPTNNALFDLPPWLVMARYEQWDWEPLRELALSHEISNPSIAFLGNGREFNWATIIYPWALHREGIKEVNLLWRYEDGSIDWEKLMNAIDDSNIVLTAPGFIGEPADKQDLDNQYNDDFVERLSKDERFLGPFKLKVGRFVTTTIFVYINKATLSSQN